MGSIVKRTSLSLRERLLLICDRLAWRFSTPLLPRRKSARKQKKPQSARQHREQFRHLRRRDAVDALTALVLHGIPQLARTYIREPPKTLSQCCSLSATLTFVSGELVKLVLVERLFNLTRDKLLRIPAFAWAYRNYQAAKAWLEATEAWQIIRSMGRSALGHLANWREKAFRNFSLQRGR